MLEQDRTRATAFTQALTHTAGACLLLAAMTLVVYWPVRTCEFIALDDPDYVVNNPHLQSGLTVEGVIWAFSTGRAGNWHPLTWLSHLLDAGLFGTNPAGPHVVNLLFHAANVVLLFLVLRQLTAAHWKSLFVAALSRCTRCTWNRWRGSRSGRTCSARCSFCSR